ncbi:MAG: hypothetical protein IT226_05180 [Flavobacteriales bacterium]|nr:hypothetical protein [Flavobacteriales bacterium]
MNRSSNQFVIIGALLVMALSGCRKNGSDDEGPYTERILFSEPFDHWGSWNALPDGMFDPDTEFVAIEEGLLKLNFDPMGYGAAWLGCELEALSIQEDSILSRLGIRINLVQGHFQNLTQWHDTVIAGQASQIGAAASTSRLRLYYNDIELWLPDPSYGRTHRDSTFDADAFKIEGSEFELIADRGMKFFRVDGVEHPLSEVNFNVNGISNHSLLIEFDLGHNVAQYPREDQLFVEKVEIYTWTGERPR